MPKTDFVIGENIKSVAFLEKERWHKQSTSKQKL